MRFIKIWKVPTATPQAFLDTLAFAIKTEIRRILPGVPETWVEPFFPKGIHPVCPKQGESHCIHVSVDTKLFVHKIWPEWVPAKIGLNTPRDPNEVAKEITERIANIMWRFFGEQYSIEVFVQNNQNDWRVVREVTQT